jgi:hypothetical protein
MLVDAAPHTDSLTRRLSRSCRAQYKTRRHHSRHRLARLMPLPLCHWHVSIAINAATAVPPSLALALPTPPPHHRATHWHWHSQPRHPAIMPLACTGTGTPDPAVRSVLVHLGSEATELDNSLDKLVLLLQFFCERSIVWEQQESLETVGYH